MKPFQITLLVIFTSIILILNFNCVSALNQDDFSISPAWSTAMYYQGDNVSVKLIMSSNSSETLTVYYIGIHFDWMDEDSFHGRDLSDDPVTVESSEVHVFDPMAISIPSDVSIGEHNYTIGIQVVEGTSTTLVSWDSSVRTIYVQHADAKVFRELLQNVMLKIGEGVNATYKNAEALSLLEKAENEYSEAIGLSYNDQYTDAIAHLQAADSYADQAAIAEQQGAEQSLLLQRLLLIIIPIVTAIIISSIVLILWRRRRPRETEEDQPMKTEEAKYDYSI